MAYEVKNPIELPRINDETLRKAINTVAKHLYPDQTFMVSTEENWKVSVGQKMIEPAATSDNGYYIIRNAGGKVEAFISRQRLDEEIKNGNIVKN